MLYRKIEKELVSNYKNKDGQILIVEGARQIGKTYIIRKTASEYFKNYIEINLKEDFISEKKYANIKSTREFYMAVSSDFGMKLGNVEDTIIFLDEIQTYPNLISLLKPLKLENKYRYIASGSLLGITMKHIFIPMGSIQELKMYPLDFEEYIIANGCGQDVINYLKECFETKTQVTESVHITMMRYFREYLICGGLPDAVNEMIVNKNIYNVRNIHRSIFTYYKDDASQYDLEHNLKIRNIYDYLPSYMENKVKRLKFNAIEGLNGTRSSKYEDEFDYLITSGCAIPASAVSNPVYPLRESTTKKLIKLYYNDVGLLSYILYSNDINTILFQDKAHNLGSIYETVCATELVAHGYELYYFDSKKVGEVDFLINNYNTGSILPIEIKSGNDQNYFRAIPKLVKEPYSLPFGYIFGNKNIIMDTNNLVIYPIYMIMFL